MENLVTIALALAVVAFIVWICIILPYKMAAKRNRSKLGWVAFSLLISPLIAIIVLLVLGDAAEKTDISETFA